MLLEIKARPDHGTKSQAQFQEMDADVARAASNPLCALLFVFETKAYRSFSLEKEDNRGRYALAADWFNQYFPKLSMIPSSEWLAIEAPRGSSRLNLWFRQSTPQKFDKVIFVLGCQVQTVR